MRMPVLTLYGPIDSPLLALDALLAYYFKTLKSQSKLHYHQTKSLMYDINRAQSPTAIETNITDSLVSMLTPYFDNIIVTVDCNQFEDKNYNLVLDFRLIDNGRTINVGQLMEFKNNRLSNVQAISKHGDI